jgi:hypothetical protein
LVVVAADVPVVVAGVVGVHVGVAVEPELGPTSSSL